MIPIVDLRSPDHLITLADACRTWGVFRLAGHGIDPALMHVVLQEARSFFRLPPASKKNLLRSADNPWGYYDRELTKNALDQKEIFDIGPRPKGDRADPFSGPTPWPRDSAQFRSTMETYFACCEAVAEKVFTLVLASLRDFELIGPPAFHHDHTGFLRLNYYPPAGSTDPATDGRGKLGIHEHTDAGILTLLLHDEIAGLQILHEGRWRSVEPARDGSLIVNIGDMMQVWANDAYKAPVHRVLGMRESERASVAFFYNPAYSTVICPLPARSGEPDRYGPISWGEFRRRRADGDYADHGKEVQISDYRIEPLVGC